MGLQNLIRQVERTTTKNRAIDGDVVELLNLQPQGFKRGGGSQPELFRDCTGAARVQTWFAPNLTESMDEAAKVIPACWRIRSLSDATGTIRARCILEKPGTDNASGTKGLDSLVGYGCNRAAAILSAALRAKAADRGEAVERSREYQPPELAA